MKESERIIVLETKFETIQTSLSELNTEFKKTSQCIYEIPNQVSEMIKGAFREHERQEKENLLLIISPIKEKQKETDEKISILKIKVQSLEFMKWQAIGMITVASIAVNFFIKYIF